MNRKTLVDEIFKKKSFLCIGLDVDVERIPQHLKKSKDPIFEFNKSIIDATHEYCVAYKPNTAFYEQYGVKGWIALEKTTHYIKENFPQHFLIADAKRGDIGNTSNAYAYAFFNQLGCDALTLSPYMGFDSLCPFFTSDNKWAIVLALTSNEGSIDFQKLKVKNDYLYMQILKKVKSWGTKNNTMFVVGATQASVLKKIRKIVPNHFLLIPGIGAQGGDLNKVIQNAFIKDCGLLINSSRSIIYASDKENFAIAAAEESKKMADEMKKCFK